MRKEFEHLPEQVSKAGDEEPDASWGGSQEEREGLRVQTSSFPPAWPWEEAKWESSALFLLQRKANHIRYLAPGRRARETGELRSRKTPRRFEMGVPEAGEDVLVIAQVLCAFCRKIAEKPKNENRLRVVSVNI